MLINSATSIVKILEEEGIRNTFCVPGESYLPLLDALYQHDAIRLISTRHESGAAFMADAYAKNEGKPGVVMATRGVGACNLSIGVHTAYQDSTPMVVLLGQVHSSFRGREGFQEVDLDRFFAPISKWSVEVRDPKRVPELLRRAFFTAKSGRPGPVVVSLPEDVLKGDITFTERRSMPVAIPSPDDAAITAACDQLRAAKRPVVIAGGGIKMAGAEQALLNFSDQFHIPVLTAFRRHDVFPNDHQNYAGHLGLGTHSNIVKTVQNADVILALGTRLSEVTTQDYSLIRSDQRLIHMDIEPDVIHKVYAPEVVVLTDAKKGLESLIQEMTGHIHAPWQSWLESCHSAYEQVSLLPESGDEPSANYCDLNIITQQLQQYLPDDAIITNDAGNFAGWLHAFYRFKQPNTYIGSTSGAMGYGLPAALGAKLSQADRTVVSLSGDGGFMMTMQEMETALRENIPIIALVFNNAMYGTIRMHQEKHFPERVIGTSLSDVNYTGLAGTIGWQAHKVTSNGAFREALLTALSQSHQPTLIEIMTDPDNISITSTISSIREDSARKE